MRAEVQQKKIRGVRHCSKCRLVRGDKASDETMASAEMPKVTSHIKHYL